MRYLLIGTGASIILLVALVALNDVAHLLGYSGIGSTKVQSLQRTLPELWAAPDFTLTNQAGETVTRDDLLGQVWVADFFFTSCPGICPMLSANMQAMNADLADHPLRDELRLVSFTVDPERDTVEVLAEYSEAIGAPPSEWLFLTGDRQAIWDLSIDGFKLEIQDTPDDPVNPILHSGKVILVDRQGMIRGYYEGLLAEGMQELQADLELLLAQ
ncbi:MAG: SCO family protein [Planctomycetota bacterium]